MPGPIIPTFTKNVKVGQPLARLTGRSGDVLLHHSGRKAVSSMRGGWPTFTLLVRCPRFAP